MEIELEIKTNPQFKVDKAVAFSIVCNADKTKLPPYDLIYWVDWENKLTPDDVGASSLIH